MKDIETYTEIEDFVKKFYKKLLLDAQIGHFFQELNLESHLPQVADFWAFILIDQAGYSGNMMTAHSKLDLSKSDFEQWLKLFHETIRENFEGTKASLAIERSTLIALTLKPKS